MTGYVLDWTNHETAHIVTKIFRYRFWLFINSIYKKKKSPVKQKIPGAWPILRRPLMLCRSCLPIQCLHLKRGKAISTWTSLNRLKFSHIKPIQKSQPSAEEVAHHKKSVMAKIYIIRKCVSFLFLFIVFNFILWLLLL